MVESDPLRVSEVLVGCADLVSEDNGHDARGQSEGRESGGKRLTEKLQSVPSYSDLGTRWGATFGCFRYVPPLLGMSSVPTTIASESTVINRVKLNGTEEGKLNKSRSRHC